MSDDKFIKFLKENREVISSWPQWKRELLGPSPKNIHENEEKDTKKYKDRFELLDMK